MATELRVLGGFSVRRGGEEVPPGAFGGRLSRTLVRFLATQRGAFVPADILVDALWPGRPPADPAANLRILVNRARKALGDPPLILTGSGGYALRRDEHCSVDAEVFLAGVEAGRDALRAGRSSDALRCFRGALGLWRGDPLPEDLYDDWAQPYRRSLIRARLEALEGGASAALALGDPRQALDLAEQAVALEPLRESAHLLVVRALASSRDSAGALAAYERMRKRLLEELGPAVATQATATSSARTLEVLDDTFNAIGQRAIAFLIVRKSTTSLWIAASVSAPTGLSAEKRIVDVAVSARRSSIRWNHRPNRVFEGAWYRNNRTGSSTASK